jgi:hypothetical protein
MVDAKFWSQLAARFRSRGWISAEWSAAAEDRGGHWRFLQPDVLAPDIEAFKLAARLGAVALGAPDTADAFLIWLDRLARDSSDFTEPLHAPTDVVCDLGALSALFCEQLEAEAAIIALTSKSTRRRANRPTYPQRAEWLRTLMARGHYTRNRLAEITGADNKSLQKILDAKGVNADVLQKLVTTLSVRPADIPHT